MAKHETSVFIIEDDGGLRNALQELFESVQLVVKTYGSAIDFLKDYDETMSGCLVVDVRLPGMSGLEFLDQLKMRNSRIPLILITAHGDIPMAVKAIQKGAMDFITKPFNEQYLIDKVQKLVDLGGKGIHLPMSSEGFNRLTQREYEVMRLVIEGKLNKQIAVELNIAKSTVELHRSRMMRKMRVKTLAQLIRLNMAAEHKIIKE